jgi:hypothetical protein
LKLKPSAILLDRFNANEYEAYAEKFFFDNERNTIFLNNLRKYFTIISSQEYKLNETIQKVFIK